MKNSSLLKFVFCGIGHAIVFLIFLFFLTQADDENATILGIHPFFKLSTNVYQLNLLVFIPYALLLYGLWLGIQFWLLNRKGTISNEKFLSQKFTPIYLILCGLGYINLIFWVLGMEGNVFGFLFFLPLMVVSVILAILEIRFFFQQSS